MSYKQIKGIITLGGLSECGKSTFGKMLESNGIMRYKIIEVERELMRRRGMKLSSKIDDSNFQKLYSENLDKVFNEFLEVLSKIMKKNNASYVVLESLYRVKLGEFIKEKFEDRSLNIFIESSFEKRVEREYRKLKSINSGTNFLHVQNLVESKDRFKLKHSAHQVKEIADIILLNDNLSLKDLKQKAEEISKKLKRN